MVMTEVCLKEAEQNLGFNIKKNHLTRKSLTCSSLFSCLTPDSMTLMLGKRFSSTVLGCSSTSNSSNTLETFMRSNKKCTFKEGFPLSYTVLFHAHKHEG